MAPMVRPDRIQPATAQGHIGAAASAGPPDCPTLPAQPWSNKHPSNRPVTSQPMTEILHSFGSNVCLIKLTLILLPCVLKQR
jgi:hypothetical protein